ncbi:hypothetical protein [Flavobacterium sp. T12S277]|uniref:hypothetical protein n=1 Tax=Flavobacterium sp. T12S277 TaxID=3402752 RepID=UPI003AE9A9EC
MKTEFWIEKSWNDSIDNATIQDINIAIEQTIKKDGEHSAFWIGHTEEEYVLKIHKNLDLFFIYGENQNKQLTIKTDNWEETRYFIQKYFTKDFLGLKNEIELKSFSNCWFVYNSGK